MTILLLLKHYLSHEAHIRARWLECNASTHLTFLGYMRRSIASKVQECV
jgi:hypothetical protein